MKHKYLEKLSRAARWSLPPAEAREVIEDYETMLAENPRTEEVLVQEIGTPRQAVRAIAQPRHYYGWWIAFGVMTACLLLSLYTAQVPVLTPWTLCLTEAGRMLALSLVFLLPGFAAALGWFRWEGDRREKLPWGVPVCLLIELLLLVGIWLVVADAMGDRTVLEQGTLRYISLKTLQYVSIPVALLGFWGMVKARMSDRRWCAVYILGLTVVILGMGTLGILAWGNMSDAPLDAAFWKGDLLLTVLGLAGAGAALR